MKSSKGWVEALLVGSWLRTFLGINDVFWEVLNDS